MYGFNSVSIISLMLQGSVQEMLNLSQQEYISRIEELNSALCQAWDQDQRVKALKIAIQVNIGVHCTLLDFNVQL